MLFIHAANVHQGGGAYLLDSLLRILGNTHKGFISLDERMQIPNEIAKQIQIKRVFPSILSRFRSELWLARSVSKKDVVLCFGNLPPLFKLTGRTIVFMQNRYLVDKVSLSSLPVKVRVRVELERVWLSWTFRNVSEFIVQTPTMKNLLDSYTRGSVSVRILPFVADINVYTRNLKSPDLSINFVYDFVYVASAEPHKNHLKLLKAWCVLAKEGFYPSLCITIDQTLFKSLSDLIDTLRSKYGIRVNNVGIQSHHNILQLYKTSLALIYPSLFESFGLPLIEARQAGLAILASELDYVRDLVDPEFTFDPESALSIARAVKRFKGWTEKPLTLLDAREFLTSVLMKDF